MPEGASGVNRRRFLKYGGVGLATTGFAGCQSLGQDGGGVNGTATDGPLKIGAIIPEPDGLGETVLKSAHVGIDVVNEAGGIDGRDVELVHGDSSGGPAAARRAHQRLTTEENVEVTVGAFNVDSIMPSIAEQETIHVTTMAPSPLPAKLVSKQVSPMGGDPEEEYEKYKYHFRAGPLNTLELIDAFIEFLELYSEERGWQKIALLGEPIVNNADALLDDIVTRLEDIGKEVTLKQKITSGIDDFSPIFDDIEEADTDLCAIVSLLTGIPMVTQWADQERDFEMGGAHIFGMFPWFWEETGGAAEGLFLGNSMTPQTENTPYTQEFMGRYRDEYGPEAAPLFAGPITYDAIRAMKFVVEENGTTNAEELVPYLENDFVWEDSTLVHAVGFRGPDETYAHDIIWDCMEACEGSYDDSDPHGPTGVPVWQQWQEGPDGDGVMEAFAPSMNKTADYVEPPWMR